MKPLIAAVIFGIMMMFVSLFVNKKQTISSIAKVLMAILLGVSIWDTAGTPVPDIINPEMYQMDALGTWLNTLLIGITLLYFLLSSSKIEKVGKHVAEYYALIFFIMAGINLVSGFNNLLILFLGIELLSIPQYILAGSDKNNLKSSEAALKYFLMGAFSTGILLMGIALLYGSMGTFQVNAPEFNFFKQGSVNVMAVAGLLLMTIALGFKVSAAPMHFWTPDVYDGAPTPFTSFMASISKAGVFVGFIRLFNEAFSAASDFWVIFLAIIILATLIIGNITAVYQQSVKRMLAYSSIAQAGFMLFAILAASEAGTDAMVIYAFAYCVATVCLFAVLMKMNDYTFDGFNGLAAKQPFVAFVAAIALFSLAGIPLTAGFFAKFYALKAVVASRPELLWLVIAALALAAVSVYYYFRIIIAMYFKKAQTENISEPFSSWDKIFLGLGALALIVVGTVPEILLKY